MASLREIKDRIGSVKSTLKITSAMKLVASSKLRKAQKSIENLRPYEEELAVILRELTGSGAGAVQMQQTLQMPEGDSVAIVPIASNSSLCGGFNANVIKKTLEVIAELEEHGKKVTVYPMGRKMSEAMKKAGYPSEDFSQFIARPSYADAVKIAGGIADDNEEVILIYNHFVTTAKQVVVVEPWLTAEKPGQKADGDSAEEVYIIEPGKEEVLERLAPQVTMLKFYAAVLDSAAAEHAARTIAMQTASDNAQDLLSELTLEYNKGRQQKITAEILDLIGGISE